MQNSGAKNVGNKKPPSNLITEVSQPRGAVLGTILRILENTVKKLM